MISRYASTMALVLALLVLVVGCAPSQENIAGDANFANRQVRAHSCDADATCEALSVQTDGLVLNGNLVENLQRDTLREGETRTYSVGGTDYEITVVFVSDPPVENAQARFSANGFLTEYLAEGACQSILDGAEICAENLIATEREGVATFTIANGGGGWYACFDADGNLYKSTLPCN